MATQYEDSLDVTAWVDITTAHSLSTGQKYTLQNRGNSRMEVSEQSSQPAVADKGYNIKEDAAWWFTQDGSLNIYVIARGGTTEYAVGEAD